MIRETYPPEDIEARVRAILGDALEGAVENWREGFWAEFDDISGAHDVLRYFSGYIEALIETVEDEPFLPEGA